MEQGERSLRAVVQRALDEYVDAPKPAYTQKPLADAVKALPRRARMDLADFIAQRLIFSLGMEAKEPCSCGCGCEPDGLWHLGEKFCVCVQLQCECTKGGQDAAATLVLCATSGALRRFGALNSFQLAAQLGLSVLLVERALCYLMEQGEVVFDKGLQRWKITPPAPAGDTPPPSGDPS